MFRLGSPRQHGVYWLSGQRLCLNFLRKAVSTFNAPPQITFVSPISTSTRTFRIFQEVFVILSSRILSFGLLLFLILVASFQVFFGYFLQFIKCFINVIVFTFDINKYSRHVYSKEWEYGKPFRILADDVATSFASIIEFSPWCAVTSSIIKIFPCLFSFR